MPNLKGAVQIFPSDLDSNSSVQEFTLGTVGLDDKGNEYVYIKAGGTIANGTVLMQSAAVAATSGLSSSTDKKTITKSSWGLTAGAYSNYYVYVNNGTDEGDLRVIKGNDANNLFLESALTASLSTDSDIEIFSPFVVEAGTASGQIVPLGVGVSAITSTYYGWMQVAGVCAVKAGGAVTANLAAKVGDDTAGQVVVVADGNDLYDVNIIGHCLLANTTADTKAIIKLVIR